MSQFGFRYDPEVKAVEAQLDELIELVEKESLKLPENIVSEKKQSALNLLRYGGFRQKDLTSLQNRLGHLGLSRLARAEDRILYSLLQVRSILKALNSLTGTPGLSDSHLTVDDSMSFLSENTRQLLGDPDPGRRIRVMVTLPSEAGDDPEISEKLIMQGMNCARINCAHDSPKTWKKMIDQVRKASAVQNKDVKIAMDLAGPKIRTGQVNGNLSDKKGQPYLLLKKGSGLQLVYTLEQVSSEHPAVTCTCPEVISQLKTGDRVCFDDGKIEGHVTRRTLQGAVIKISRAKPGGTKLRCDKGINLPDTQLNLSGLTLKDKRDFEFVAAHADIVNLSFVNSVSDLEELFELIDLFEADHLGIILKIETKRGYNSLHKLLLKTMTRENPCGVMIARGDLAIEAGWENIGIVQQEILRSCTAAHLPVVWATQVLENMAKKGTPSRSELSDISQSLKADCIMLNKGPYIIEALTFLNKLLVQGENFQHKNKAMLPSLMELL